MLAPRRPHTSGPLLGREQGGWGCAGQRADACAPGRCCSTRAGRQRAGRHQWDTTSVAIRPVLIVRPAVLNCSANGGQRARGFATARVPQAQPDARRAHLLAAGARPRKVVVRPDQERGEYRKENACAAVRLSALPGAPHAAVAGARRARALAVAGRTEADHDRIADALAQRRLVAEEVCGPGAGRARASARAARQLWPARCASHGASAPQCA